MRSEAESGRPQPALALNYDELLLLEAVLCFHTRASTSPKLRARLADLWEQVGRVRMAASARTVCAEAAQAPNRATGSVGSPGNEPGRS